MLLVSSSGNYRSRPPYLSRPKRAKFAMSKNVDLVAQKMLKLVPAEFKEKVYPDE